MTEWAKGGPLLSPLLCHIWAKSTAGGYSSDADGRRRCSSLDCQRRLRSRLLARLGKRRWSSATDFKGEVERRILLERCGPTAHGAADFTGIVSGAQGHGRSFGSGRRSRLISRHHGGE